MNSQPFPSLKKVKYPGIEPFHLKNQYLQLDPDHLKNYWIEIDYLEDQELIKVRRDRQERRTVFKVDGSAYEDIDHDEFIEIAGEEADPAIRQRATMTLGVPVTHGYFQRDYWRDGWLAR